MHRSLILLEVYEIQVGIINTHILITDSNCTRRSSCEENDIEDLKTTGNEFMIYANVITQILLYTLFLSVYMYTYMYITSK